MVTLRTDWSKLLYQTLVWTDAAFVLKRYFKMKTWLEPQMLLCSYNATNRNVSVANSTAIYFTGVEIVE